MTTEEAMLIKRIRELNAPFTSVPAHIPPCFRQLTGLRAVLCDIYGTLLASKAGGPADSYCPDFPAAFQAGLQAVGWNIDLPTAVEGVNLFNTVLVSEQDRLKSCGIKYPEVDVRIIWKKVLAELSRSSDAALEGNDKMIARLAVEYENRINPVWPMPDAEGVLSKLVPAGFVPGIVSNAQFYTPLTLSALLGEKWKSWFRPSLCFWSYEYEEAKPGLTLYHRALAALNRSFGINPHEVIMIGNSIENDVRPALACGCQAILFAGDRRSLMLGNENPCRISSWPWLTITAWSQLAEILAPGP